MNFLTKPFDNIRIRQAFALSIQLFVGLVVGGVGSISGTLFGGLFALFAPNIAEWVSKGLAGAIYGIILVLVIYVMPSGAAGRSELVGVDPVSQPPLYVGTLVP